MTVTLNEHEWAEKMLSDHSLGDKPFETLTIIARYYLDMGYTKKQTSKMLEVFLIQCDPSTSVPKWADTIEFSIKAAGKRKALVENNIVITEPEIKKIKSLKGKQIQRLAFTLLCLSKYWDLVGTDHWVNNKDTDIMKMANIKTSTKRQSEMYHELNALGMIQFSKRVDSTNVRVCFQEDGPEAIKISDFRNLGYQYLKYLGEPYFECKCCGVVSKTISPEGAGRHQIYCSECANKIRIKQTVNSVMRQRKHKGS